MSAIYILPDVATADMIYQFCENHQADNGYCGSRYWVCYINEDGVDFDSICYKQFEQIDNTIQELQRRVYFQRKMELAGKSPSEAKIPDDKIMKPIARETDIFSMSNYSRNLLTSMQNTSPDNLGYGEFLYVMRNFFNVDDILAHDTLSFLSIQVGLGAGVQRYQVLARNDHVLATKSHKVWLYAFDNIHYPFPKIVPMTNYPELNWHQFVRDAPQDENSYRAYSKGLNVTIRYITHGKVSNAYFKRESSESDMPPIWEHISPLLDRIDSALGNE